MTLWRRIKRVIFRRRYKLLGAINLLVEVHTQDGYKDHDWDWHIQSGAIPRPWLQNEYVEAWRTLRHAIGRRAE